MCAMAAAMLRITLISRGLLRGCYVSAGALRMQMDMTLLQITHILCNCLTLSCDFMRRSMCLNSLAPRPSSNRLKQWQLQACWCQCTPLLWPMQFSCRLAPLFLSCCRGAGEYGLILTSFSQRTPGRLAVREWTTIGWLGSAWHLCFRQLRPKTSTQLS